MKRFYLKKINVNEIFISACETGDYIIVSDLLNSIKDFNIDITDDLGKSGLSLAIENDHLEVEKTKHFHQSIKNYQKNISVIAPNRGLIKNKNIIHLTDYYISTNLILSLSILLV